MNYGKRIIWKGLQNVDHANNVSMIKAVMESILYDETQTWNG